MCLFNESTDGALWCGEDQRGEQVSERNRRACAEIQRASCGTAFVH